MLGHLAGQRIHGSGKSDIPGAEKPFDGQVVGHDVVYSGISRLRVIPNQDWQRGQMAIDSCQTLAQQLWVSVGND